MGRFASLMRAIAILLLVAAAVATPSAAAGPECIQVHPWSELCEGDVGGFVDAVVGEVCVEALAVCVHVDACALDPRCLLPPPACPGGPPCPPDPTLREPLPVACVQAIPWSYLCGGDVERFVRYFVDGARVLA